MNIIKEFKTSNHYKHFLLAIPVCFVFTLLCGLGLASGMELKDKLYGNKWDWKDWTWTMIGSAVGQILQVLFILLIV